MSRETASKKYAREARKRAAEREIKHLRAQINRIDDELERLGGGLSHDTKRQLTLDKAHHKLRIEELQREHGVRL